jgi:SAM-dependent methyltransferase
LIEVARARGPTGAGSIELVVGDAGALPFEAGEFDACRADRTLQHLADPQASLAEIARVTRSGGRVVVTESRWGLVAPSLDRKVTGCVLSVMATEAERASWLGDRLPSLLDRAGLTGVEVTSTDVNLDDFDDIARFINLGWSLDAAVQAGSISRAQAEDWTGGLRDLTGRGDAFVLVLFLHVSADKP